MAKKPHREPRLTLVRLIVMTYAAYAVTRYIENFLEV
jgi:hypothetical protein